MSGIYTADTSTQSTGGFTVSKTYKTKDNPDIKFYSKAGIYNSADNTIKVFTNYTDALTIDANQKVICNGSLITNLTWNNIDGKPSFFDGTWTSLSGKPTNFQSDWLTTVINKPSLFDGTWTSLSGKPTNFQSDWNSTIINKPSLFDGTWTSLSGKPTTFPSDWNKINSVDVISPIMVAPTTNQLSLSYDSSLTKVGIGNSLSVVKTASAPLAYTGNNIALNYDTNTLTLTAGNLLTTIRNANAPLSWSSATVSLSYDSSLGLNGTQLSVQKSATAPLSYTGNTIALSYDSTLTLNGTQLSVATSAAASKWTTSGTNIYNSNAGNVGINNQSPVEKLDVNGNIYSRSNLISGNQSSIISSYTVGTLNTITGTNNKYLLFNASGTLVLSGSLICDILIVGGGGSGGARHAGGGGAGAVIYLTNQTLAAGTYSITVGSGGAAVNIGGGANPGASPGNNGNDSIITLNSVEKYKAKGGGGGAAATTSLGISGGSSGGSCGGTQQVSNPVLTTNIPSGAYGNLGGKGSVSGGDNVYSGGGGGGAGVVGGDANQTAVNGTGGNGGNGIQIAITGTNVYYGGGGGGGISINGNTAGSGGSGGGGAGSKGAIKATDGTANTGGGGGGSGFHPTGNNQGESGAGGSGVVIIRFTDAANTNSLIINNYTNVIKSKLSISPFTASSGSDNGFSLNLTDTLNSVNNNLLNLCSIGGASRLGINTTTPTKTLEVNGDAKVSGSIDISTITPSSTLNINGAGLIVNTGGITSKNGAANGYSVLNAGGGNAYGGYVAFHNYDGTRYGYVGWNDGTNYINLASENGMNGYNINGTLKVNLIRSAVNQWNYSQDGIHRFYYGNGSTTYYGTGWEHTWRNYNQEDVMNVGTTGYLTARFESVANSGTDYLGVQVNTTQGYTYYSTIKIMYGSFTGFHRFFFEDEDFNITTDEDWFNFKKEYEGRLVISTGKIKTHMRDVGDDKEWYPAYDKDGITIEDTHPIVKLSRTKKDKKVIGVIGLNRNNSAADRIICNGLGEGAIWIVNTNGNLENGDLLQSSDEMGYAEKADDDLIRNYTVGKMTMDCDFQLDSPYYKCEVIDEVRDLRRAFVACIYMCS